MWLAQQLRLVEACDGAAARPQIHQSFAKDILANALDDEALDLGRRGKDLPSNEGKSISQDEAADLLRRRGWNRHLPRNSHLAA